MLIFTFLYFTCSLESICFAILIGISCDFVIHFGHAYNHLPGDTSKQERTKFALIHMGKWLYNLNNYR